MLELLADRFFISFRNAPQQRLRIFDPPRKLVIDQESAMSSEDISVRLEKKECKLEFLPSAAGGSTASQTAAGSIESNNRIIRNALHKCETAMIGEGLDVDPVYLKDQVMWC